MVGVIDFNAVEGDVCAYLVEQWEIIEGKVAFLAARVSNKADGAAAVRGIDGHCHIRHDRAKTCFANHAHGTWPVGGIAVFAQQAALTARPSPFPRLSCPTPFPAPHM